MDIKSILTSALVALVVAGGVTVLVGGNQSALGGSTSDDWTAASISSTGDTNVGDDLIFDAVWCVDFYATSTDTRVSLTASSTATVTGQTTEDGVILFNYGSCQ